MNILNKYKSFVIPKMINYFSYKNIMEVPKIYKVVLNIGFGPNSFDKKLIDIFLNELRLISGQKPILLKSKKSISNFKIRKNQIIGCKTTLRKKRMWSFIERFIYITIPRIRDFRGLSCKSFDKQGNYNLGIKEQIIFTEIEYDKVNKINGIDINISIKSKSIKESFILLKYLDFPLLKLE